MITAPSISIAFSCWRTGDVLSAFSLMIVQLDDCAAWWLCSLMIVQPIIVAIIISLRAGFTYLTVVAENYKVSNNPGHDLNHCDNAVVRCSPPLLPTAISGDGDGQNAIIIRISKVHVNVSGPHLLCSCLKMFLSNTSGTTVHTVFKTGTRFSHSWVEAYSAKQRNASPGWTTCH